MRLFLANQAIPSVRLHPAIFASMSVTSSARHVKSKGSTKIWRCFIVNRGPLRHGGIGAGCKTFGRDDRTCEGTRRDA
jgi:hypothetical protein